jgi:catechol 2,3-dioxygenase-like lactoylglutathione lyase family enzyme
MSETGSTTRITRVGTIILPVVDQDRALEFYVDTLGFETRMDGPFGDGQRWIEVAPPGAATTIALVPQGSAAGIEVSLATADAESDHAVMTAKGVDADAELIRMGEGVPPMFTFRDTDGNHFRMVERA